MIKSNKKGFTLIELLVVIAIIGLLSTLAVVALNSARQKSRDSKRVADVKQIQTALELYFADLNGYPAAASAVALGGTAANSLSSVGFSGSAQGTTYMGLVPLAPTPYDSATCSSANSYSYYSTQADQYLIQFCLGNKVGDLAAGVKTASPAGIK
jgi:general secretion pathway protein G